MEFHEAMMRRALQIARGGEGHVSPNPMVGAVITDPSGRIIGEGYHRRWGGPHAEVNAVRSVESQDALTDATIYVTLEPCSHYGKTPPCAKMLIEKGLKRVVVGATDPNPKVAGRGIAMMREAGIEVITGMLEEECRALNPTFITAHTLGRPFITLKWAQTADGFIDSNRDISGGEAALKISSPLGSVLVHRLRSLHDGIMAGSGTILSDRPRLDCRLWAAAASNPRPVIADRRNRVSGNAFPTERNEIRITGYDSLRNVMERLYMEEGMTSILVEGGAELLSSFLREGLYDMVRVETGRAEAGVSGTVKAPPTPPFPPLKTFDVDGNTISVYSQNPLIRVNYI